MGNYRMKNFEFEHDGKTYWYSRSIACIGFIFAYDKKEEKYILAIKRGSAVTNTGKWSVPGGYLDHDETLKECLFREVYEETGVDLKDLINFKMPCYLIKINDVPNTKKQNVVFDYSCVLPQYIENYNITNKHAEPNEIDEVRWIKLSEIDSFNWAFDVKNKINNAIMSLKYDNLI